MNAGAIKQNTDKINIPIQMEFDFEHNKRNPQKLRDVLTTHNTKIANYSWNGQRAEVGNTSGTLQANLAKFIFHCPVWVLERNNVYFNVQIHLYQ